MRVIVSIEEGLGNAIQAMPLIHAVHEHLGVEVDTLCTNRTLEFLRCQPIIRHTLDLKTFKPEGRYDIGFVTQYTSGASVRILKPHCEELFYNLSPNWQIESEAQCNLDLAQHIGVFEGVDNFPVTFPGVNVPFIDNGPKVAFHAGCFESPVWATRKWPMGYWVDLIAKIRAEGFTPVIIGEGSAGCESDVLCMAIGPHIYVKNMSLPYVAGTLRQSKFLISLDSGIMHLAGTQGIPQISLWGPTSEIKSRPLNPLNRIVRIEDMPCKRCYTNNRALWLSCNDNVCMRRITPGMIFDIFREMTR